MPSTKNSPCTPPSSISQPPPSIKATREIKKPREPKREHLTDSVKIEKIKRNLFKNEPVDFCYLIVPLEPKSFSDIKIINPFEQNFDTDPFSRHVLMFPGYDKRFEIYSEAKSTERNHHFMQVAMLIMYNLGHLDWNQETVLTGRVLIKVYDEESLMLFKKAFACYYSMQITLDDVCSKFDKPETITKISNLFYNHLTTVFYIPAFGDVSRIITDVHTELTGDSNHFSCNVLEYDENETIEDIGGKFLLDTFLDLFEKNSVRKYGLLRSRIHCIEKEKIKALKIQTRDQETLAALEKSIKELGEMI